ncbi:MAG: hypothetical protein K1563_07880 [Candidatus Thiodiazotropha sp. (ex. Lucinisca nassula)]|nr:hypothetical protein [Candidatus Thiodiazotropha sp. (ex. Lucinisca nassula)]MBW9273593.1 hypothetical protein [Candidatus Thiodiazotropha sp. (ex. Lucinisca nassula)]
MSRNDYIEMLVKEHCKDELRIIQTRTKPHPEPYRMPKGYRIDAATDEEIAHEEKKIQAYRLKLLGLPQAEFDGLVKELVDKNKADQRRRDQKLFFNRPDANADFEYWGKVAGYKPEEAAALLLGKSPDKVTFDSLKPYSQISDFPKKYTQSFTLVSRAVSMGELRNPIQPRLFLEWAKQKKIDFPDELAKVIEECSSDTEIRTYETQKNTITILKKAVSDLKEVVSSQKETIEILLGKHAELKEHYDELYEQSLEVTEALKAERAKQQTPAEAGQSGVVPDSVYWREFQSKTLAAIDAFPEWANKQTNKIQISTVIDWLTAKNMPVEADKREAELIKKVLTDIYPKYF